MIPVYFGPMEGLTDSVYRRVHHECFSDVSEYYIPFISPTQNRVLTGREMRNILPAENAGVPCVPQVLTKDPELFLWAADQLKDMGYKEINLNAGCPSGTVTAKGKGAGMLRDPAELDRFLKNVCSRSPLPVSVKTRIGYDSPAEWERLLAVYGSYPLSRLIVHPRTCRERYAPNTLHMDCFDNACLAYHRPLIYNGDLFDMGDVHAFLEKHPSVSGIMLARGLVANPALAREMNGGKTLSVAEMVLFHDRLCLELEKYYQPDIVFMKLRVVMKHIACCFENAEKQEKKIRKSRNLRELLETDRSLFENCCLKENPAFVPED